jgi:methylenetetrahydrofolate dehydrogenase (NADP+) / methenyltetrahydrofolate cyclohydrolase
VTAQTMDGTAVAVTALDRIRNDAQEFALQYGRPPVLATVLVGDDPASHTYVRMKANRCKTVGIESRRIEIPAHATTEEVVDRIQELSQDPGIDGILLQHPVPPHVDGRAAFEAITPSKDVDGVTYASFAQMALGAPGFRAATPGGIISLLDAYDVQLSGKHAVVIGRSPILGKPVGMLLLQRDATVTYCHSKTTDLDAIVSTADIVIAAVGQPELIQGSWIKPGAVVIDAGYNPGNVGDVEYEKARSVASLITPVPGGVGPMTIATLLEQTLTAARHRHALAGI